MKTVLFVPGFKDNIKSRDYTSTIKNIEIQGYKVEFVNINWNRTTIDDWVRELDTIYEKHKPNQTILAGFSYGAMTAFMSATIKNPSELWLFSLSPYFAEDIVSKKMKPSWLKVIEKRRVSAFNELNFAKLSKLISCKTILFAGNLELEKWPILAHRIKQAHRLLSDSSLVVVDNAGHDVTNSDYINSIVKAI